MIILAIETSCDDTCIAVVEADKRGYLRGITRMKLEIKSNIVSSQVKIHAKYGGVYPFLAKREHQRNLPIVLKKALGEAGFEISNFQPGTRAKPRTRAELGSGLSRTELRSGAGLGAGLVPHRNKVSGTGFPISKKNSNTKSQIPNIDLIAVTVGPGLEPCLWTGVNFAKDLSRKWEKPLIPVNHIEAHIFANFVRVNSKFQIPNFKTIFPAICLVVSGGHTQLILMKDFGQYKILGETRDDAAGECFDKTARILGLGYPGGPAIAAEAAKLQTTNYKPQTKLPRPMIHQKNFDFSFSGLKTAVLYDFENRPLKIRKSPKESLRLPTGQAKKYIRAMAAEIQQAIIDVLIGKTIRAAKEFKTKSIILGGGVAANNELRKQFNYKLKTLTYKLNFFVPPKKLCTDNAAMVAITGYFNYLKGKIGKIKNWENIKVNANLRI